MAIAYQPPHIAAQQAKQADLARRINSPDTVERWNAKGEALSGGLAQFGRGMVAQAEQTAKRYQEQMRFYERSDRENNKYKPLPKGANIVK